MPDLERMIAGLRCRDLLTQLADYVDGDLSAEDVRRVNAHLDACEHCTKFGGEYGTLVEGLRARLLVERVDPNVHARLATRMEAVWATEGEDAY